MFENLTTKSLLYQENHALDCMEIEELRRICREETERARQLRTDELDAQKKEELSTVNQLLSQIRTLQDKVNALSEDKEFYDPETARSPGMSHVPVKPREFRVPEACSAAILDYRTFRGTHRVLQETFLKICLEKD